MAPWAFAGLLFVGFASVAWPRVAHAEAEPVRVHYSAAAGCSSREAFVRELAARTSRVRASDVPGAGATFVVELADHSGGVTGQLRWLEPAGGETVRTVSGATCEEVVSALALIAAVLVDPASLTRNPTSPGPAAVPRPADAERWRFRPSLGAGARLTTAVGPGWSLGPGLELGLEMESLGRRGPAASVAVERLSSPTQITRAGDADFATTLARLSLCPWSFPSTGKLFVAPCAAFEVGSLHAAGTRTLGPDDVSVLWLAADPVASLAYRPLRSLSLELSFAGVFPLVRGRFIFGPALPIFSIPVAGLSMLVGVRAVLP
jgi:hypothetical protein